MRDTSDFPSLNGQNTTVLPCARTRKQNQHVNTRDLDSFPALSQESGLPLKPQNPTNNVRMATVLKKSTEPPKSDRNRDATAGPSIPRMPNQARDFPSLDGNQQQFKTKEIALTTSINNSSGSSWVSKAKTANENGQDEKKKTKKEQMTTKKKIAEAPKLLGASDFPNLNKKLEPTKSNLAKLGNKKKPDNSKKTAGCAVQEIQNNNQNSKKSGGVQVITVTENNSSTNFKKSSTLDSPNKSTDNSNKENSRPKAKLAENQQCNGRGEISTTKTATSGKTDKNDVKVISSESAGKESSFKKKENPQLPDRPEEAVTDNNNQKDKKKRKKNENNNKESTFSVIEANSRQPLENLLKTPKIPPGFENAVHQHVVRAPPGLTGGGNRPQQQQIKAPPGLSLTTGYNHHNNNNNVHAATIKVPYEYVHPVDSSVRNKILINNLMAALISDRDKRFDTFEKFKEMSTLFRKHTITAYNFYSYCIEALCPQNFETIFLELVLLLPDIQKQQVGHLLLTAAVPKLFWFMHPYILKIKTGPAINKLIIILCYLNI